MTTHADVDPLWMPLLTHYADAPGRPLDTRRTAAHVRHLTPHVCQYLVGGTTGDGWDMSDAVLDDWLDLLGTPGVFDACHKVLIGALAKTTEEVIARARRIERRIENRPLAAAFAAITVCAPVDPEAGQDAIETHFRAIAGATRSPLAIYQLPQVTGCEIAPETFASLTADSPRIRYFKDTSGTDAVAKSGVATGDVVMLRGAEGDYHRHLKPYGRYDGWLLSTANGFAPVLRSIAQAVAAGEAGVAQAEGDALTALVESLFEVAGEVGAGNAFSNINRAVDHLLAYGAAWHDAPPPLLVSGDRLPRSFLEGVEVLLTGAGYALGPGYLAAAE